MKQLFKLCENLFFSILFLHLNILWLLGMTQFRLYNTPKERITQTIYCKTARRTEEGLRQENIWIYLKRQSLWDNLCCCFAIRGVVPFCWKTWKLLLWDTNPKNVICLCYNGGIAVNSVKGLKNNLNLLVNFTWYIITLL